MGDEQGQDATANRPVREPLARDLASAAVLAEAATDRANAARGTT